MKNSYNIYNKNSMDELLYYIRQLFIFTLLSMHYTDVRILKFGVDHFNYLSQTSILL